MNPSQQLAGQRSRAPVTGLRWLLVGMVLVGVFGMHVLNACETTGHGPIVDHSAAAAVAPSHHFAPAKSVEGQNTTTGAAVMSMPAPADGGGALSMAACVLFIVVGGGALLLAMTRAMRQRAPASSSGGSVAAGLHFPLRGPPGIGLPRVSLCVLRI